MNRYVGNLAPMRGVFLNYLVILTTEEERDV
jgi:hypothetical protein